MVLPIPLQYLAGYGGGPATPIAGIRTDSRGEGLYCGTCHRSAGQVAPIQVPVQISAAAQARHD